MLSARFQQPQACGPSPVLCSVAFRSSFICSLLLALDSYGGNDPDDMFPIFYKRVAPKLASKLAVIFRHLVRVGSFLACWRLADVVPVLQGSAAFSDVGDYRPISITLVLSKVFENILVGKLSHFLERKSMPLSFSFRTEGVWEHVMLCLHCLTVCRFLTNQKNWLGVGTIASTLAQYSAIYWNTWGQFSWFVGLLWIGA